MQLWIALVLTASSLVAGLPRADFQESVNHEITGDDVDIGIQRTEVQFTPKEGQKEDSDLKRISRESLGRAERGLEKDNSTPELKVTIPETDIATAPSEDDNVRSKKSASLRDSPHLTTVCIQVRSDHPSIVCGPQVDDEEEEESDTGARSSLGANKMYYRQQMFGRSKGLQGFPGTSQFRLQDVSARTVPAGLPSAARSPQFTRSENGPVDAHPTASSQPGRGSPNTPTIQGGSTPVMVHSNVFPTPGRMIPYPSVRGPPLPFSPISNVPSPYSAGMRLNCQTDPWTGDTVFRSAGMSEPQLVQIGDQLVALQERPTPIVSPFRSAQDQFGYQDSLVGSTFIGEDGRAYMIDEGQARAAADDHFLRQLYDLGNFRSDPTVPQNTQQLQDDLQKAQQQIAELTKKVTGWEKDDELKKLKKDITEHQEDTTEKKKSDTGNTKKRQTKHNSSSR